MYRLQHFGDIIPDPNWAGRIDELKKRKNGKNAYFVTRPSSERSCFGGSQQGTDELKTRLLSPSICKCRPSLQPSSPKAEPGLEGSFDGPETAVLGHRTSGSLEILIQPAVLQSMLL